MIQQEKEKQSISFLIPYFYFFKKEKKIGKNLNLFDLFLKKTSMCLKIQRYQCNHCLLLKKDIR